MQPATHNFCVHSSASYCISVHSKLHRGILLAQECISAVSDQLRKYQQLMISAMHCSRGGRCQGRHANLNADHFRKAGHGPGSTDFFKTCCFCRKVSPIPLATPRSRRANVDCIVCGFTFATPSFRDARNRLRNTCQSCLDQQQSQPAPTTPGTAATGLIRSRPVATPDGHPTPGTQRGAPRPRQEVVSPTPRRNQDLPPTELGRPTRARRPPQLPYATPPSPPPGLAERHAAQSLAPPRFDRHAGQSRCYKCKTWKAQSEFYQLGEGSRRLKTCSTCREASRAAYHRRQQSPTASPIMEASNDAFLPIPATPDNLEENCLSQAAIECIGNFHSAMAAETMETCENCKERWFGLDVREGRCSRCRIDGEKWTSSNCMDPGEVPHWCLSCPY